MTTLMNTMKSVAQWMRDRDVGIDELVKLSSLERRVVEAIIQGRYTSSPSQRQRIADALQVDPSEIQWGRSMEVDHMYGHGPQFGRSP